MGWVLNNQFTSLLLVGSFRVVKPSRPYSPKTSLSKLCFNKIAPPRPSGTK